MWRNFLLFLFFTRARALNDAEGKKLFEDHVHKCAAKNHIDAAELSGLRNLEVPTKTEIKCLLACVYRAIGTLDSDGMFDIQKGYEFAELMKDGDERRLENGKKVALLCLMVNDRQVTDGTKGCDRAALIFKCMIETAPKYGFNFH